MKQRLLTGIIALLVTVCAVAQTTSALPWDGTTTPWTQGAGTQANPYLIENGAHLAYLAQQVNAGNAYSGTYFKLTTDIDLLHMPWISIGSDDAHPFSGVFNGDQYSVFNVQPSPSEYIGLFGVTSGAQISNLFINSNISLTTTSTLRVGGMVAKAVNTEFNNCHTMGSYCVKVSEASTAGIYVYVGGMVGDAADCTFSSSHNYAAINATDSVVSHELCTNSGFTFAGGIAAKATNSTFSCTSNFGSIRSKAYSHVVVKSGSVSYAMAFAGGLVGAGNCNIVSKTYTYDGDCKSWDWWGRCTAYEQLTGYLFYPDFTSLASSQNTFERCYNTGNITAIVRADNISQRSNCWVYTGGICGWGGTTTNCYNRGNINAYSIWASSKDNQGNRQTGTAAGMGWGVKATNCYNTGRLSVTCPTTQVAPDLLGHDNDTLKDGTPQPTYIWQTGAILKAYPISGDYISDNGAKNRYSSTTNCYYYDNIYEPSATNLPAGGSTAYTNLQMVSADFPAKLGSEFIQDTVNINNNYPIFATCKPYATTLDILKVDSTHAVVNGAYKYLSSPDSVGYEYKLRNEEYFVSVRVPLTGNNPSSLPFELGDLLRGKEYTYRIWLDEAGKRHYGDTLHFTTTCPAHNVTYNDTICVGDAYQLHDFEVYYGSAYAWNEATCRGEYRNAGTFKYVRNLQTVWGCDSIVTLNLTICKDYSVEISESIRDGDAPYIYPMPENYRWGEIPENQRTFYTGGTKTINLRSVAGCNSTVSLVLEIRPTYTVLTQPNNVRYGETNCEGGPFEAGLWATIVATPKSNYHFVQWSNGSTDATTQVRVVGNATYTAIFAPDEYKVTTGVNIDTMGTVSPSGLHIIGYDSAYVVTAKPFEGYDFVGWSDGAAAGTDLVRTYIGAARDTVFNAVFKIREYNVTTSVPSATMGSVTPGGKKPYKSEFCIIATANEGFEFAGWSNGVPRDENPYCYRVAARDTNIQALFTAKQYLVETKAEPDGMGDVTPGGYKDYLSNFNVEAVARPGYKFIGWKDGYGAYPNRTYQVLGKDTVLRAMFAPATYNILVESNSSEQGSVSGGGVATYNALFESLTATPKPGYEFDRWQDNNTDNPRSFTYLGTKDSTFTAYFRPISYNIRTEVVSGKGEVNPADANCDYKKSVMFTATPYRGYKLKAWDTGSQGTTRTYTVNEPRDTVVRVTFEPIDVNVYVTCNSSYGTVEVVGGAAHKYDSLVTIKAVPNPGYRFANWEGSSSDAVYEFRISSIRDTTFKAIFEPGDYHVTIQANNPVMGSLNYATGMYAYGTQLYITAAPNPGYTIEGWEYQPSAGTSATVAYNVQALDHDTVFQVNFKPIQYMITTYVADGDGSVSPSASPVDYQGKLTVTATPGAGKSFKFWKIGDQVVSPDAVFTYTHTTVGNVRLDAYFADRVFRVRTATNGSSLGDVTGAGQYGHNEVAEITAVPKPGYRFDHWEDNYPDNPYLYTVTADTTLRAVFVAADFPVTVRSANDRQGSVNPTVTNEDHTFKTSMSIQAVPETGYVFSHWTGKSGATIPGLPSSFTYIIEAVDTTFTAHFVPNKFYLNVLSSNPDWGTASPASGDQTFGTTITLSATPKLGYKFTGWSDGNTNSSRSYTIGASNATITANFAKDDFPLTVNNDGHGTTTPAGRNEYEYQSTVNITATPSTGYEFSHWQNGDINPSVSYYVVADDSIYTAYFKPLYFTISTSVDGGSSKGSVTKFVDKQAFGTDITITATPAEGYEFDYWEGTAESNESFSYTVEAHDAAFKAHFKPRQFHVTTKARYDLGTVTPASQSWDFGTSLSIEVTANPGFKFKGWSDGYGTTNPRPYTVVARTDTTFEALFDTLSYKINISADNPNIGSVSGGGTYKYTTTHTLTATPKTGYHFVCWSDNNSTDNPRDFEINVPRDTTFQAIFDTTYYPVRTEVKDHIGGTVTPGGSKPYNTLFNIYAFEADGYYFYGWSNGYTVNPLPYTVAAKPDTLFVAEFKPRNYNVITQLATGCDPSWGTTSPSTKSVAYTSSCQVTATANPGYHFVEWTDTHNDLSPRTVDLTHPDDTILYALFAPNVYEIEVGSANEAQGEATVSCDGGVTQSTQCNVEYKGSFTLTATPKDGYEFDRWQDNTGGDTRTVTSFKGLKDSTFTAYFKPKSFNISGAVKSGKGTIDPVYQSCEFQKTVTFVAEADPGYQVKAWPDGSTGFRYGYRVAEPRDTVIRVEFEPIIYNIGVASGGNGSAAIVCSGVPADNCAVAYESTFSITATPDAGYTFDRWSDGSQTATRNNITYLGTKDSTITAYFKPLSYKVKVVVNNGAYGEVSPVECDVTYQTSSKLTATPYTGYTFTQWRETGSANTEWNFLMNKIPSNGTDTTIHADFAPRTFTFTVFCRQWYYNRFGYSNLQRTLLLFGHTGAWLRVCRLERRQHECSAHRPHLVGLEGLDHHGQLQTEKM